MSRDLECPKCRNDRFQPIRAIFGFRRNWLGRWQRVKLSDIAGCERCGRVWEISESGSIALLSEPAAREDAPVERKPAKDDAGDENDREDGLRGAVRRASV